MTTFNFSNFVVDKSEILGESQRGILSHLTYVGMSIRDSKNYPKSIVKYHSEDRKVSEGAMISCQNGRKFARMYAVFGFGLLKFVWVTQICLLSSLYYFHVSILYSHV